MNQATLLRISKQSIADLVPGLNPDAIMVQNKPSDYGLGDNDVLKIQDNLVVRVRNGLTLGERARFAENAFRNELRFNSGSTVSQITKDAERGQSAGLA